jgi:phosphoglycolate phosphatase
MTALVVFDLDGTLIDSRRDLSDSANLLVIERGGQPLAADAITRMVGDGAAMLVKRALAAANLPFAESDVTRFLKIYDERLLQHTQPYSGMAEALNEIATFATIAVLTNKPGGPAKTILSGLGLSAQVAVTIGGDGTHPRKPDPGSLQHLMSRYAVSPAATVMVGDTRIDFETSRNAGTHVCMARYGFGYEQFDASRLTAADAVVDQPSDIPAAVRRLLQLPIASH